MTRKSAIAHLEHKVIGCKTFGESKADGVNVTALEMAVEALKEEPRPTAHWEEVRDMWGDSLWRCDHCGIEWTFIEGTPKDNGTKYCPNCGARMVD